MFHTSTAVAYRHLKHSWRQPGRFWHEHDGADGADVLYGLGLL